MFSRLKAFGHVYNLFIDIAFLQQNSYKKPLFPIAIGITVKFLCQRLYTILDLPYFCQIIKFKKDEYKNSSYRQ